ncbi:hypothetical protein LA6_003635 [Marinibacterium anthonyi]|nr:hypothetical protein LA6_003635 [Marinibacterium anthonyi]
MRLVLRTRVLRTLAICATGLPATAVTAVTAQDAYETFVGQYMAAVNIATTCHETTVASRPSAGGIAQSTAGLRGQKVLRLIYYSPQDALIDLGNATLAARGIDPQNRDQVCRFGRGIAARNDTIGRFLRPR